MHRGLPVVTSKESVDFGSSESEFGASVNFEMLTWTLEISSFGSWMNSYVPSASDIVSTCNAVVGFSEVLKYSFPSLKSCYLIK